MPNSAPTHQLPDNKAPNLQHHTISLRTSNTTSPNPDSATHTHHTLIYHSQTHKPINTSPHHHTSEHSTPNIQHKTVTPHTQSHSDIITHYHTPPPNHNLNTQNPQHTIIIIDSITRTRHTTHNITSIAYDERRSKDPEPKIRTNGAGRDATVTGSYIR